MRYRFAAILLFVTGLAPAQVPLRDVTPDDYFTLATVTDLAVSPDGKHVAYCESRWDLAANDRKADLWLVTTDGKGKPKRLTGDRANERHLRWAADGKAVYVLANRKRSAETKPPYDGSTQVWRVPADGGETTAVTRVEGGVAGYDYAPKADALFYSIEPDATPTGPFADLKRKYKVEYGHGGNKVSEIHRLDLQSWRAEKVIDEKQYVREFAVTRDGKRVAMIAARDETVIASEGGSRVVVWDAESKKVSPTDEEWRKTAGSPWPWLENLAWSPDGYKLAYCSIFDAYPAEIIINQWKDGNWVGERMSRSEGVYVRGYGSPLKWMTDHFLGYLVDRKGRVLYRTYVHPRKTTAEPPAHFDPDGVIFAFDVSYDGRARVEVVGTREHMPVLRGRVDDEDRWVILVDPNPHTKTWKLPSVEHTVWKTPDGTDVGGPLELPHGYKKGDKPLPLVVAIHGGPTTSATAVQNFDPHNGRLYFAAKGYAVLCPNYRGSTGYGDKFVIDLIGNENEIEVKDILAGIQHLIQEGIADPDRVAVMGWSNGGYLTNCLITLKDPPVKIKAASSGAGILDTVAEWGFNDEPAYPRVFKKGLPWEQPELYKKTSPTYGLGNVTTPTLIHVGGNDVRCPPGHSRMLYRALAEYLKVPAELVVYPGEPHGLSKANHRKAKMEWDLAWFEKYLK